MKKSLLIYLLILGGFSLYGRGTPPYVLQNVYARNYETLNGSWNHIVDPFDNGYYDYRMNINRSGFFRNQKQANPSDLVEYNFDTSPCLQVPGDWNTQDDRLFFYEGSVWYKRDFNFEPREGERQFIYFGAVNYFCNIYLNGREIATHEGGFTPFSVEVTDKLREGHNFLILRVNNDRHPENVPTVNFDWWNYDDWRITLNYNIARNINRIEKLPENLPESSYSLRNGTYAQRIIVGAPVGSFFGYRYLGVYDTTLETYARDARGAVMTDLDGKPIVMKNGTYTCFPGDAKYQDINHDGVINQSDIVYIGNANPVVTGGGGFTAKFKQLTLTGFLHYRLGQKIVNQARMNSEAMYGTDNQSLSVLRRWRSPGDDTDIPRALWQYGYNYLGSDRFVEDCSFLRLKTISFSYGLPKNFCRKIKVNTINAFVTAYDLLTWTNYTGQDPEVTLPSRVTDIAMDRAQTPPSKRISGGLIINF
jgi:hypothetical protein